MVALTMVMIVLAFLTADLLVQWSAQARATRTARLPKVELAPVPLRRPPADVFLTPAHAWVRLERDGPVTVGADPLATALLGAPETVTLPAPGARLTRGGVLADLSREGRHLSLRSPLSGVVAAVNPSLASGGDALDTAPWSDGWLVRLHPDDPRPALSEGRLGDEAAAWLRQEAVRARDAVARLAAQARPVAGATMLDGGPLAGPASDHLSDDDWEALVEDTFGPVDHPEGSGR